MTPPLTPHPPCETRAENHITKNNKIRKSRKWKDARQMFLIDNPFCVYCGEMSRIVHHPEDSMYEEDYIDFSRCEAVCGSCHYYGHHGYERCDCGKGWRKPGAEYCRECIPESTKETAYIWKAKMKKLRRELDKKSREMWKARLSKEVKEP